MQLSHYPPWHHKTLMATPFNYLICEFADKNNFNKTVFNMVFPADYDQDSPITVTLMRQKNSFSREIINAINIASTTQSPLVL